MGKKELQIETRQKTPGTAIHGKWWKNFMTNLFLCVSGIIMAASGGIIQICYHLGHKPDGFVVFTLRRMEWNSLHVWTSAVFSLLAAYHVWAHRKWCENVFKQHFPSKNRSTILLAFLMIVTMISGLTPWFVNLFEGNSSFRGLMVEVHDKLAIVFFVVAFLHTLKRRRWWGGAIRKALRL